MSFLLIACSKNGNDKLFKLIPGNQSGIKFSNKLRESYGENMLLFSNFYNGGGVGILDINNDGLQDVILGGNQTSSRLYLNKGGLKFEDITENAKISTNRWITGISIVDINSDGFDDVYFSVSGFLNAGQTKNQLFINNGDNTFSEKAEEYGLAEIEQTTQTNFFDFDNDGDLDAFMALNPSDFSLFNMGRKKKPKLNGEARSTDKLFENLGNGKFVDISKKAGILIEGYSLGLNTSDFNNDGLTDILVTNDFIQNDILYINNGDGTFTNKLKSYFEVTSYASMGNDVGDINNDGLIDIITLDMLPEDSFREKMLIPSSSYNAYQYTLKLGYHPQFTRNVLQINNGDETFSEIGQLAGVARTDWSWSTLFADLDNDGFKDLFVTNGFRRDLGNLDYIVYNQYSPFTNPGSDIMKQIEEIHKTPGVRIPNYVFKNNGDLTYSKKIKEWGFELPTYSSGLATVDFDLDGDLDIIINNVDMEASLYENLSNQKSNNHYLEVSLESTSKSQTVYGSKIYIFMNDEQQMIEFTPYRGYLSSVGDIIHFGLGEYSKVDSLKVQWPNGRWSNYTNPPIDTLINVTNELEYLKPEPLNFKDAKRMQFTDITDSVGLNFVHKENNQVDFQRQFLLPHQHSRLGPSVAVADVNGDGLDDCFIGGAKGQTGQLFLQQSNSTFKSVPWTYDKDYEDMGALFFDYDSDGDNDLYISSGGTHAHSDLSLYQDRLYNNDGKGNFIKTTGVLPKMNMSTGSVISSDFDKDGDLDLFVGGRIIPQEYPSTPTSYLLLNEGGVFTDVTDKLAPGLSQIGMVSQGLWTDYDNDKDLDLLIVGEWIPISLFENKEGYFENIGPELGLNETGGWWNSIIGSDQNGDGYIDYTLGNLGGNNDYNASISHPLVLKSKDYDDNGSIDPILLKEFSDGNHPIVSRDEFLGQLSFMRSYYRSYQIYAETKSEDLFPKEVYEGSVTHKASILKNTVLKNFNGDSLVHIPMSNELQFAPIYGGVNFDIDADGVQEIILSGNFYSSNVVNGPYTSSTGAVVSWQNDSYIVKRGHKNGLNYRGDRKGLATIKFANGDMGIISTVNNGKSTVHKINSNLNSIEYGPNEYRATIHMLNGSILTREFYYGSGYISQNTRHLILPKGWKSITFLGFNDETRKVEANNFKD